MAQEWSARAKNALVIVLTPGSILRELSDSLELYAIFHFGLAPPIYSFIPGSCSSHLSSCLGHIHLATVTLTHSYNTVKDGGLATSIHLIHHGWKLVP